MSAGLRSRQEAVSSVLACFLTCLALGCCFSIGNLTTYVTSYLRASGQSVEFADTMWLDSVLRMSQGFVYAPGGLLYRRLGARLTCLLGAGLVLAGMALSAAAVNAPLPCLLATYSVLQGAGIGIALAAASLACVAWFPRRAGLTLGVTMGGFGLGPLLFTWLQTGYLNPRDVPAGPDGYFRDPDLLRRVPSMFLIQAAAQGALLLTALLLLREPPPPSRPDATHLRRLQNRAAEPEKNVPSDRDTEKQPERPSHRVGILDTLRSREFYQILLMYIPAKLAFEFFQITWKTFGQTFVGQDSFLATVGTVAPLWVLLGDIVWGHLGDLTSFKSVLVVANGLLSILFSTFALTQHLGVAAYCIWVWCLSFCFSSLFCGSLPLVKHVFGEWNAGVILGLMNGIRSLFTPVTPVLAKLLLEQHGYPTLLVIQGGFTLFGMCSLITLRPERWRSHAHPSRSVSQQKTGVGADIAEYNKTVGQWDYSIEVTTGHQ